MAAVAANLGPLPVGFAQFQIDPKGKLKSVAPEHRGLSRGQSVLSVRARVVIGPVRLLRGPLRALVGIIWRIPTVFSARRTSAVGTKRRLGNVRFCAACGGYADIDQRRRS
jgi:hypothetical protein